MKAEQKKMPDVISTDETAKLQQYIRSKFGNDGLSLRQRAQTRDSVEVLLDGEFIGVIYKDTEDGDTSYDFNMAILEFDLPK